MIASQTVSKRKIKLPQISKTQIPVVATTVVLLFLIGYGALKFRHFFELSNFLGIIKDNSYLGIVAAGMTFVIISGGIDLSVGAVVACSGVILATLMAKGMGPMEAIPIVLLIGAAFGTAMGFLIARFEIPPFLVTLAGMFLARGIGLIINQDSIEIKNDLVARFSESFYGEMAVMAFVIACSAVLLHMTPFGRSVFAIGCNETSSKLMGLPVLRTKIMLYGISGFLSALAGIVFAMSMSSASANVVEGLELDAIASVVIGGTLLTGGIGTVFGTLMGVFTLSIINIFPTFANIDAWWAKIYTGGLVCAFILLQKLVGVRQSSKG